MDYKGSCTYTFDLRLKITNSNFKVANSSANGKLFQPVVPAKPNFELTGNRLFISNFINTK